MKKFTCLLWYDMIYVKRKLNEESWRYSIWDFFLFRDQKKGIANIMVVIIINAKD